jgi:hypothetical protein
MNNSSKQAKYALIALSMAMLACVLPFSSNRAPQMSEEEIQAAVRETMQAAEPVEEAEAAEESEALDLPDLPTFTPVDLSDFENEGEGAEEVEAATDTPAPPSPTPTSMTTVTPTVPLQNGQCLKGGKNSFELRIINNANQNVFVWAKWGGLQDRLYVCEVPPGEFTLWLEPHHYDAVSFVCDGKSTYAGAFHFQKDEKETLTVPRNACGN